MGAEPSLSVDVILSIYTRAEIDENLVRLKKELENLYRTASGGGKMGERDTIAVRNDLEAFGQAKKILIGRGGNLVQTQATFAPRGDCLNPESANWDGGQGV